MNDDTPWSAAVRAKLAQLRGYECASIRMSTAAYEQLLAHGELTRLATSGDPLPEDIEVIFDHEAGTVTLSRDPGEPVQVRYTAMRVPKPRREAQWKRETNRRFR